MTREQLIDGVMNDLFMRGKPVPHPKDMSEYLERHSDDDLPSHAELFQLALTHPKLIDTSKKPASKATFSPSGSSEEWLAIHEAGHAIVGLGMGLALTGVRFYKGGEDGEEGQAVLHNFDETDEAAIRQLIAVDVAGNMAQIISPGCKSPKGGYLSQFYKSGLTARSRCPTDFIAADQKAHDLLIDLGQISTLNNTDPSTWPAKADILKRAEEEAVKILHESKSLKRLASELMNGIMKGSDVKRIVGDAKKS